MRITVTQMETEEDSCVNHRNAKCKCKEMHLNVTYLLHNCQCKRSASTDARNGVIFISFDLHLRYHFTCAFSFRLLMHLKKFERWDNRAKTFCRTWPRSPLRNFEKCHAGQKRVGKKRDSSAIPKKEFLLVGYDLVAGLSLRFQVAG